MAGMEKSAAILAAVIAVLATAAPAFADRGGRATPDPGFGRMDPVERREMMREMRRDETWRENRREAWRERHPEFGHLSPEERRQLRHDIRSAREGMPRRPPPPPPPPGYPFWRD